MRTKFGKILLTCLLFAIASVYGNSSKAGAVTFSTAHEAGGPDYSHSSLNCNNELELSGTYSWNSVSRQVSVKKFNDFGSVENTQAFGLRRNDLFSFPAATADNRSVHLLLIFPSHYFW